MGPIALYPDPLIAQILPAATFPTDIVLAARMVARGAAPQEFETQDWDPSVKALAHYPSIIKMMDERLEWTQQVGAVFARQPDDVMNSVQRLRVKARALGHLQDTPQQQVIVEDDQPQTTVVRIVPASTQVVYVPTYDPQIVYVQPYTTSYIASPYIWFGAGFSIGAWLNLDCDWYARRCYYPVGWSWSYCRYPSWGLHFGWSSGYRYYDCNRRYWCGPSYGYGHSGGWRHRSFDNNYYDRTGRTNDAHIRSWSRDGSRPAPHLRTSTSIDTSWASNRGSAGREGVPGHRRTLDSGLRADVGRADRIASPPRRRGDDAVPQMGSSDSLRRTMSPSQVQDRLSRATPGRVNTPRADTSPRSSDRNVPDMRVRGSAPANNADALRRTRQLPPVNTNGNRAVNGGYRGGGTIAVPGSGDVRGGSGVRTVTPSRPSAPRMSMPSSGGRSTPSARPSSPGPSRQAAPRSSPSPSRNSAPASRGSTPQNRRSR